MARLSSDLTKIARETPEAGRKALLQTAADIVAITKALAPEDTGALRRSYGAVPLSSDDIIIGTDSPYAVFVEFGTTRAGAQPHLSPAFAQAEVTFAARLKEEMERLT